MSIEAVGSSGYDYFDDEFVDLGGSVGGSIKGKADSDEAKVGFEGHFRHDDEHGGRFSGGATASGKRDREGKVSGEIEVEFEYNKPFSLFKPYYLKV